MSHYQITTGFRAGSPVTVGVVGLLCLDCAPIGIGGVIIYQGDDPLDLAELHAAVEAHEDEAHTYGAAGITLRAVRPLFGDEERPRG